MGARSEEQRCGHTDTFRVGEDVRLHLAVENLHVEGSVYSADSARDPLRRCQARGSGCGRRFATRERPISALVFLYRPYVMGEVVALEWPLGAEGWLLHRAGTSLERAAYTVAHASATTRIVGRDEMMSHPRTNLAGQPYRCSSKHWVPTGFLGRG